MMLTARDDQSGNMEQWRWNGVGSRELSRTFAMSLCQDKKLHWQDAAEHGIVR